MCMCVLLLLLLRVKYNKRTMMRKEEEKTENAKIISPDQLECFNTTIKWWNTTHLWRLKGKAPYRNVCRRKKDQISDDDNVRLNMKNIRNISQECASVGMMSGHFCSFYTFYHLILCYSIQPSVWNVLNSIQQSNFNVKNTLSIDAN